jgi:hypothetical protein
VLTEAAAAEAERARVDEAMHVPRVALAVRPLLGRTARAVHVLDAKYRPGDRCTVLYEVDGRLVVGRLDLAREGPEAELRLLALPEDPALPGLPTVLDATAMAERLGAELGWPVRRCRPALVRYRPDKRATVRLDLAGGGGRATVFAKVYHDPEKARRVHEVMRELRGALAGRELALAAPVAHLADLAVVLQAPLAGRPLDDGHVAGAAVGLAALHDVGHAVDRPRPAAGTLDKVEARARRAAAVAPATGEAMLALVERLRAAAEAHGIGARPPVLVHGDCKPGQFLVDGDRVALLDFDHVGAAEPALDVGSFVASCRPPGAPAGGAFLAAYVAATGAGEDLREPVAWYQALALLTKAERAFARSWRSPAPAALLADAWRSLDGPGGPP